MKPNKKHQFTGIYCIRNLFNNKVYIGKSKNIYKRIHQHIYDLNNHDKRKMENEYLVNSWIKYGKDSFEYIVLEKTEDEIHTAEKELYWMKIFDSLNKEKGYNLRSDSDSKMICNIKTKLKISERVKKEWELGFRKNHGKKLSDNWKTTPDRNNKQSQIMTKNLTKYSYKIDNEFINYKELCLRGYKNALSEFYKKKTNIIKLKGKMIERIIIDDIVQSL